MSRLKVPVSIVRVGIGIVMMGVILFLFVKEKAREREEAKVVSIAGAPEEASLTPDDPFDIVHWKRAEGPLRVGIQAGHLQYTEAPDELEGVRNNGGGTSASGVPEWQVNLAVAERIAEKLRDKGMVVDILPATVPPRYSADAFVALHADGNDSTAVSGYKVAAARRDMTGQAGRLSRLIEEHYGRATDLPLDPNVTRAMRGYYAFSWYRFEHAIHPMTPGVIVEMGFLSNPREARFLINNPDIPAQAITDAIVSFLASS